MKKQPKGFAPLMAVAFVTIVAVVGGGYLYINKDAFLNTDRNSESEVLPNNIDSNETLPAIVRQNNPPVNKMKSSLSIVAKGGNEVSASVKVEMQKAIDDISAFLAVSDKAVVQQFSVNIFLEEMKVRLENNLAILNSTDEKMKERVKKLDPDLFSEFAIRQELLDGVDDDLRRARIITDAAKEINFIPNNTDPMIQFMDLDEYRFDQMRQTSIGKDLADARINDSLIFFFDINKVAIYRGSSVIKIIDGFKNNEPQF